MSIRRPAHDLTPTPVAPVHGAGPVVLVLLAAALFGTTGTAVQQGPDSATTLGVGAARLLVGGATLALVARWHRPPVPRSWRHHLRSSLFGGAMVAVYQLSFFHATRHAGVALATVCTIASGPVFSGLIQWARFHHVPSRHWVTGTAICIAGVAVLGLAGRTGGDPEAVGVATAMLAGLGYASYASAAKHQMDAGLDPAGSMAALFCLGGLLTAPLLLVEPIGWLRTGGGIVMLLHLGVVTVGVAYTAYGRGLARLATPTVVTLTLLEPITAAVLSVVVLDERLRTTGWLGVGAVLVGLLVTSRARAAAAPEIPL
jgi:DME family drug/metabolite transporter